MHVVYNADPPENGRGAVNCAEAMIKTHNANDEYADFDMVITAQDIFAACPEARNIVLPASDAPVPSAAPANAPAPILDPVADGEEESMEDLVPLTVDELCEARRQELGLPKELTASELRAASDRKRCLDDDDDYETVPKRPKQAAPADAARVGAAGGDESGSSEDDEKPLSGRPKQAARADAARVGAAGGDEGGSSGVEATGSDGADDLLVSALRIIYPSGPKSKENLDSIFNELNQSNNPRVQQAWNLLGDEHEREKWLNPRKRNTKHYLESALPSLQRAVKTAFPRHELKRTKGDPWVIVKSQIGDPSASA
jgi:hypothetical protein